LQFTFTPDAAQSVAIAVAKDLKSAGFKVAAEVAVGDNVPYRTTLLGHKSATAILVECQGEPSYEHNLQTLAGWLAIRRLDAEMYVATRADAHLSGTLMQRLKADGIGLIFVDEGDEVEVSFRGLNHALVVTPPPGLALGRLKTEVADLYKTFNKGDRKQALKDLTELVERETKALVLKAARKRWITKTEAELEAMSWSAQIDVIAGKASCTVGHKPLMDPPLKADAHSFRGGRNLVTHNVKNKWGEAKRERQFAERMLMGARLAAEMLSLQRKVI
jgi:hypothetical protein